MRRRLARVAIVLLVVVTALVAVRLAALEREGPPHVDISVGDGIPATLYVPGEAEVGELPVQRPPDERPPLVVVAHGYSADQQIMSPLARSLTEAGYATLTFDFRGHGSNTQAFEGDLRDDLAAALDWAETSPYVDGERIAVLGHSMGAGAALDFAGVDERVAAVIPVSGGYAVSDARPPPDVLFLVAERDPSFIHDRQEDLAEVLEGISDVRRVEIGGTDHITILYADDTVAETVAFLDGVFGLDRSGGAGVEDPRLPPAGLYLLLSLGMVALLGVAAGSFVPRIPAALGGGSAGRGLLYVAGSLVVTMPLMASGGPAFLPLGAGQPVVVHLLLASALLWALRLGAQRGAGAWSGAAPLGEGSWLPSRPALATGGAAGIALFLLLTPLAPVFHRLVPTAERAVLWLVVAAMALPFFAAFEALVRRGTTWTALGWGLLGRLVLLVVLALGVGLEILPGVLALVIPLLVLQFVLLELFAATCFARARDPALIAVVDTVFVAWIVVTLTPIG